MDYSNFDYKEACKKYSSLELEILLFKSRLAFSVQFVQKAQKNYGSCDIFSLIVLAGYFINRLIFYVFDCLIYLAKHKNSEIDVSRYSKIVWKPSKIDSIINNDTGYTTFEEINTLKEEVEEIKEKIVEECRQENCAEDISDNKPIEDIVKELVEEAKEELRKSRRENDNDYLSACEYYINGDYEKAIEKLERTCQTDDSYSWGFYWCGSSYYEIKDYEKAIEKLEKACELNNNEHDFLYKCGQAYFEIGEYKKAAEKLERACELNDSDFRCFHLCGDAYYQIGEYEKAFEKYDKNMQTE